MRIAFISDAAYPWTVGGIEAAQRNEAEQLAKVHDVDFYSMRWPEMKKDFKEKGITYHAGFSTNQQKFYRHRRRSVRTALLWTLNCFALFGHKYDVVEVNMFPILHIPVVKLYCMLTGTKMVMFVAEVWSKEYWKQYLGDYWGRLANRFTGVFLGSANAYIAISSSTASDLHKAGVNKERINTFIPVLNDIGLAKVKESEKGADIIYSGRFIKEKRLDSFIAVVGEVSKKLPKVKAWIIGDGPEMAQLQSQIKEAGLEKNIEIKPFYENKDSLYRVMKSAKLFLMMSEREGLSIVTLESLALGTPVVLPDYSPIPKEVKEMCVVEKEDKLAKDVIEILKSKDKSKFIRNKGNLAQFQISRTLGFYSEVFRKMGL